MINRFFLILALIHYNSSASIIEKDFAHIEQYYSYKEKLIEHYSCDIDPQHMDYYALTRKAINALRYIDNEQPHKNMFQFFSTEDQQKILTTNKKMSKVETLEMRVLCINSTYGWIFKNSIFPPNNEGIGTGYLIVEKITFETEGEIKLINMVPLPQSKIFYEFTESETFIMFYELDFNKGKKP